MEGDLAWRQNESARSLSIWNSSTWFVRVPTEASIPNLSQTNDDVGQLSLLFLHISWLKLWISNSRNNCFHYFTVIGYTDLTTFKRWKSLKARWNQVTRQKAWTEVAPPNTPNCRFLRSIGKICHPIVPSSAPIHLFLVHSTSILSLISVAPASKPFQYILIIKLNHINA